MRAHKLSLIITVGCNAHCPSDDNDKVKTCFAICTAALITPGREHIEVCFQ